MEKVLTLNYLETDLVPNVEANLHAFALLARLIQIGLITMLPHAQLISCLCRAHTGLQLPHCRAGGASGGVRERGGLLLLSSASIYSSSLQQFHSHANKHVTSSCHVGALNTWLAGMRVGECRCFNLSSVSMQRR